MNILLRPATEESRGVTAFGVITLLIASAASLLAAPSLLPRSYSWVSNGTSESAAQGIEGAWLARLGFLTFGLGVLWLAWSLRAVWARAALWLHVGFGVCMVAAATFSTRPWIVDAPYDRVEDALHSFAADAMGFAFALGIVVRWIQRGRGDPVGRLVDGVAIAAATFIPLLMSFARDSYGLTQRLMFLVAYAWYAREAVQPLPAPGRIGQGRGDRARAGG